MKKTKRKYIPKAQDGNYDLAPIDMPQTGYPNPPDNLYGDPQLQVKPYNQNMNPHMSFSDWTGLANGLAVGTTVLANTINSQKDFHKEQAKYYSELYGHPVQNNYTENDNPIYMKNGGGLTKDTAFKILGAGAIKGNKLTPKQKYFFEKVSQGMSEKEAQAASNKKYGAPKAQDGYGTGSQISKIMQQCAVELQQGNKPEAILQELVKSGINKQQGVQIIQQVMSQLQKGGSDEHENPNQPEEQPDTMKAGGKWIPNNLHKGRCKNPGSPECPKGSPQYNLAMTFKKHHGFQKAEYGMGIPETDGNSSPQDAWVEAEGGEMYQQPDGQVMKIADDAPSHEQGGVPLQNVDKVLEDTSTSRTDDASKSLRITPTNFKAMFGFNTNRTVSHSEALDLVDKYYQKKATKYGGKINASLETLNKYPDNVYANNSLQLNTQAVSSLPTRDHAFNYLFQHQENVKQMMGADNSAQAAIGWEIGDDNNPYSGGVNSKQTKYNLPISIEQLNRKWQQAAGIDGTNMSNKDFQSKIYDWALQNDPQQIRSIWAQWKNTNQGKRLGVGKNYDFNNLSDQQLANLKSAYVDGSLGARTLIPKQNYDTTPIDRTQPGYPTPPDNLSGTPDINVNGTPPAADNASPNYGVNPARPSRFNEPLHWYDLAGPLMTLASASRIPAKYNPAKFNEVRLKLQNPEPALAAGQQQYNQATSLLPTDSQTVLPQIFAAKYAQDNQVLGQYQNINSGIKNQEVMYNANVRDRQSQSDQQSRGVFEQQMLGSLEAERQQKLSAFDDLFTRIALNRKLNREGNLIQQLAPNYNQYGQFNGNQRYLATGVNDGIGGQGGVTFKTMYDENGKAYRMAFDAKGRPISNSKMITDKSSIGTNR